MKGVFLAVALVLSVHGQICRNGIIEIGEECEPGGHGCGINCTCEFGVAFSPPRVDCNVGLESGSICSRTSRQRVLAAGLVNPGSDTVGFPLSQTLFSPSNFPSPARIVGWNVVLEGEETTGPLELQGL